jgi:hypothetical protein
MPLKGYPYAYTVFEIGINHWCKSVARPHTLAQSVARPSA